MGRRRLALVEVVRLVLVTLFAVGGWQIAEAVDPGASETLLVGIVVGCGAGYVLGGFLVRGTASAMSDLERELRRVPAPELLAGSIGLVMGLVPAALISIPLFRLPPILAFTTSALVYVVFGYLGQRVARSRYEDLFAVFGVKTRVSGTKKGEVAVLDSSALMDGRLGTLVRMGFLEGSLLVPRGVLEELQAIADSGDPARRSRGRRALDLLVVLRRDPSVDVMLVEDEERGQGPHSVDVGLVRLARARGGAVVTNDTALAKVAEALDVPVRSINALAEALRPEVLPGDRATLQLVRPGRDHGQAIGYLEDGTMVIVEGAAHLVGRTLEVVMTNAVQTSSGRLVFARVGEEASA